MIISKEYQENSLLIYQGVFTVNLISILGNHIRLLPEHEPRYLQNIFKIFVEVSQNVSYYSAKTSQVKDGLFCGIGWVTVQESANYYTVTTGNPIHPEHAPKLEQYCNQINSFDEEQLRKLKRDTRSEALMRDTGAQIGLIQTSIISGNKLDFKISDFDKNNLFFIISTKVNKESE